jgi:rhodanese-related sulfurtransferase
VNDINIGEVGEDGVRYVTPAQAHEILQKHKDIVVLDVRTSKEYKEDHIKGAVNINYFSLNFKKNLKALDADKTYLLHCAVGGRSQKSIKTMNAVGIDKIIHMDYGLNQWREEGLPLEMP